MISNRKFALLLTSIFMLLELMLLLNHEMSRDEFGALQVARSSPSIYTVFKLHKDTRERHPALWWLMLYFLNCATNSPLSIQILHWVITGLIVYIFTAYSCFTRLQKALFPFGYMILYEYGVMGRQFSVGILLFFIFCCLFEVRYKRFITVSLVLSLLANTHIIGTIIACACFVSLASEAILSWKKINSYVTMRKLALGMGLGVVSGLFFGIQCLVPYEYTSNYYPEALRNAGPRLLGAINSISNGLFPIWIPSISSRNIKVLDLFGPTLELIISLFIVLYTSILLVRMRSVLWIYALSTFGMIALFFGQPGIYRHIGYHYIMFIGSLWLLRCANAEKTQVRHNCGSGRVLSSLEEKFLYLILVVQICCSIMPVSMDLLYPYSAGLNLAQWIKRSNKEDWLIVGHPHYALTPTTGYLDKELYALEFDAIMRAPNQFILEDQEERTPLPVLLSKIPRLKKLYGNKILFVFARPLSTESVEQYNLTEAARFDKAMEESERFWVYVFKENKPA